LADASQAHVSWPLAFKLFLLGFCLIVVGIVLMAVSSVFSNGSADFGEIIIVGPIPIIIGIGENPWLVVLMTAVSIIIFVASFLLLKRRKDGE
jgi:uncharacterized membrane protein